MENTPPPAVPTPFNSRICPLCQTPNPDWLNHCFHCGTPIPETDQSVRAEISHISYLLGQISWWRSRNLLSPDLASKLQDEYSLRQHRMQVKLGALPIAEERVPDVAPPIVPPLPAHLIPQSTAGPTPHPAWLPSISLSGHVIPSASGDPRIPDQTRTSAPSKRSSGSARGIAVFLQEHALKIVFALATVLVLIALRSILGWNQTSGLFLALTPLLPLSLTAMFWQFGRRTQTENPWAAFVYQSLTAVLLGFDLFILDRFWLTALHLSLPTKLLLFTASGVSTASCAWNWRRNRYGAMWHLLQVGILATLFFALQAARQLLWQPVDWRPSPLLLFGPAYLAAAIVYFACAARTSHQRSEEEEKPTEAWRPAWLLWANLSVVTAFILCAFALKSPLELYSDDFLFVFMLAGILYGSIAQALGDARLVYVASSLCLVSGLAWIPRLHQGAVSCSMLFLSVSMTALALQGYNRRSSGRRALATAWTHVALTGNTIALVFLGGQTLLSLGESNSFQLVRFGLELICGLQFFILSVQESEASLCYPAILSIGIGLVSLLQCVHTPLDRYPLSVTLYAALLVILSYRITVAGTVGDSTPGTQPALLPAVRTSSKVALTLSLVAGSTLALTHSHSTWIVVSLFLGGLLCAIVGSREPSLVWAYAALYGLASAMGLLTLILAPLSLTFTECMLPFVLLCAGGAFAASLTKKVPDTVSSRSISRGIGLWREPMVDAGLLALAATLVAAWSHLCLGEFTYLFEYPAHLTLDTSVCIVAALLLSASRRVSGTDPRRVTALVLLNVATALGIAGLTGLAFDGHSIPMGAWQPFLVGLLIQSSGYWFLARTLYLFSASEAWSEDLSQVALAPAFLSALMTTLPALGSSSSFSPLTLPPVLLSGGAFLLVHLEMLRSRRANLLVLSVSILLLAGLSLLLGHKGLQPYPAISLAALSVPAAGSYLQLARRLKSADTAYLTLLPLLGGAMLALIQFGTFTLSAQDSIWANAVWVTGGLAIAWNYLSAAKWTNQASFVYLSGITLIAAYLRAVSWAYPLLHTWDALLMLPVLLGMAALSLRPPKGWEMLEHPYLEVAISASILGLVWSTLMGEGWLGLTHAATPNLTTLTLAAYGVAYLALAVLRKTRTSLATAVAILTLSYLHLLLGKTPLLAPEHPTLTWPLFAFLFIQAALIWTCVGGLLKKHSRFPQLASPVLYVAQAVAVISALCAVASVHAPHQGDLGVLTLVWAAGVWFGLWALEQGVNCLHVGTGNLLVAWCLIIYRTLGVQVNLLDVYLLPFGLYLLLLGHLISHQQKQREAQTFWGMGLLVTLTPALLTRWTHAPGWHAALLMTECIVCVLWGVAQRIRVFVAAGLGTLVFYAASVLIGTLPDTITTILALLAGVALFVFGFYALTHQERMKQLTALIQQRWTIWHSWR